MTGKSRALAVGVLGGADHASGNWSVAAGQNTWCDLWFHCGRDSVGELVHSGQCSARAGTTSIRPTPVPRSQGAIRTNVPTIEDTVPRTGPTTADPPHSAADDDVHVGHMERCHLSCSHNDPPAAERSRWMGATRRNPEMWGAPPW